MKAQVIILGEGKIIVGAGHTTDDQAGLIMFSLSDKVRPIGDIDPSDPVVSVFDEIPFGIKFLNLESVEVVSKALEVVRNHMMMKNVTQKGLRL